MTSKNKYYFRSRIKEAKFRRLVRCFALDFTATKAALLTKISVRSVNTIYLKIRQRLTENNENQDQIKVVDNFNLEKALSKIRTIDLKALENKTSLLAIYGVVNHNNTISTTILPGHAEYAIKALDSDNNTLKSTVTQLFELSQYDALIAIYPGMRMQLYLLHSTNNNNHSQPEEVDTESFWAFTKLRLTKFNGIPMQTFFLHLKETEFRFNHRYDDIYDELLKMLRTNPL
ncbi:MAG: IS1595 family transposase [Nitrosomonas sp.]|nr:IS1595 family transposase [Nitrosomonas sp.]